MKQIKAEKPVIKTKDGSSHDFVFIVELFDKLRRLKAQYMIDCRYDRDARFPDPWEKDYQKITQEKENARKRMTEIDQLFKYLDQWQRERRLPTGCELLLQSYRVIRSSSDITSILALETIVKSDVKFTETTLSSPFAENGIVRIKDIELAEIILAMYRLSCPFPDRPSMRNVTLTSAQECVEEHPLDYNGQRVFDYVDLGVGPVMFKLWVSNNDTVFDVTEYNGKQPLAQIAIAQVLRRKMHFCQFTGYTKGLIELTAIHHDEEKGIYEYTLATNNLTENLQLHSNIQLNGVLGCIVKVDPTQIVVSTADELVMASGLSHVQLGDHLSLGLNAMMEPLENSHYLLDASATKIVELSSAHVQPGHEHTYQLNFTASERLDEIQEDKHIGLNGSSLTAKNVKHDNNITTFSIFCGRATRETSQFNEQMAIGAKVNYTPRKV